MAKRSNPPWTVADSSELYQINAWGSEYFSINEQGNVVVSAGGKAHVDLHELVKDLVKRGYSTPLVVRFSDVLEHRVNALSKNFTKAIKDYDYKGRYRPVYPIKVNQQRPVVEELIEFGKPHGLGLEAGSKPELLVAITLLEDSDALLICNGYKDIEYIETALLSTRLGRNTIIVIDRFAELDLVLSASKRLGIKPRLGVRVKLNARGSGKWAESGGDKSKFGLSSAELVKVVKQLEKADLTDCLEMLHFHIGSQITTIRAIAGALREASRVYVELCALGANLKLLDVGGGLGVDYDGSQTSFHSSTNYSSQEYANDVVTVIQDTCDAKGLPHPDIVSESGRALTAHHSILLFNVLGVNSSFDEREPEPKAETEHNVVKDLYDTWAGITRKNYIEAYHDAMLAKEEGSTLFNLGYLDLVGRARVEQLFWGCCAKILKIVREEDRVPEDLKDLDRSLGDTYFCNFSVFQSVPDHWAVRQLFPTMPIQRLNEEPKRRGILADLTCDSDGKVDQFIDSHDVKDALELHGMNGDPYYVGMFLVGAYQETLGDLHNLFGDTNVLHVSMDKDHGYRIDNVVEGDSVGEVLGYVQYERRELMAKLRAATETAVRQGRLDIEESTLLRRRFMDALSGYTYLYPDE